MISNFNFTQRLWGSYRARSSALAGERELREDRRNLKVTGEGETKPVKLRQVRMGEELRCLGGAWKSGGLREDHGGRTGVGSQSRCEECDLQREGVSPRALVAGCGCSFRAAEWADLIEGADLIAQRGNSLPRPPI